MEFEEPWKMLSDGVGASPHDGYRVKHRDIIKNRSDAPHLAICMPIGPKDDNVKDAEGNVIYGYRSPGLIPIELMMNQMHLTQPLGVSITWLVMKNNLSAILRQEMTDQALEMGANFIFYWDDDVLIPPNTLYRMLGWMARYPDIGAISGVYFTKFSPPEPILYKDSGTGAYWGFDTDPDAPPEDVYAFGAGCVMARTGAIKMMTPKYWDDERTGSDDGRKQGILGHDIRFCRKMRDETGYRVCVDGAIQCNHMDLKEGRAYMLPDVRPTRDEGREAADRHSHLTPEDIEKASSESTIEEIEAELGV